MLESSQRESAREMSLLETFVVIAASWKLLLVLPACVALIAALTSLVMPIKYETTTFVLADGHRPQELLDVFIAAVSGKPDISERLGPSYSAIRKHLVRDLVVSPLDGHGRMKITYRNTNAVDAEAVMAVVLAEFSTLADEASMKIADERAEIESRRRSVDILERTATALLARVASDYDVFSEQVAYERMTKTLVAVTTELQARRDYLTTSELPHREYQITGLTYAPQPVRESSPIIISGLWWWIALIATAAFILFRAAIRNASQDPRSSGAVKKVASTFPFSI